MIGAARTVQQTNDCQRYVCCGKRGCGAAIVQTNDDCDDEQCMAESKHGIQKNAVAEIGFAAVGRPCFSAQLSPCWEADDEAIDIDSRQ
jgi:hypothetical protein